MQSNRGIRCPHCGKETDPTATYCWACGRTLDSPADATLASQQIKHTTSESGRAYTSLALGIMAFVLLCLAPLSALLAVCSIVKGARHLRESGAHRGIATVGIVTGSVALMVAVSLCFHAPRMMAGFTSADFQEYKNKPAPDFALTDTKGTMHSLARYRGSVVVLNFWSTW